MVAGHAMLCHVTRATAWRIPAVGVLSLLLAVLIFVSPNYLGRGGPFLVLAIALQVLLLVLVAASTAFIVGYFFRLGWEAAARRQQTVR